jgi:D-sedoheptulose 7-phosphate isomerase
MDRRSLGNKIDESLVRKATEIWNATSSKLVVSVATFCEKVVACLNAGNKLIVFGNGGSSSDASHFCAEITGRFKKDRKAYPALCLNDPSFITAIGNDFGFDRVFERGVDAFGKQGDLVLAISTSGNSPNVVLGVVRAKELGLDVVCLIGKDGGLLHAFDHVVNVGLESTDSIQELHMSILHTVVEVAEQELT